MLIAFSVQSVIRSQTIPNGYYYIVSAGNGSGYSGGPYNYENQYGLYNKNGKVRWKSFDKSDTCFVYYISAAGVGYTMYNVVDNSYFGEGDRGYGGNVSAESYPIARPQKLYPGNAVNKFSFSWANNGCVYALRPSHNGAEDETSGNLSVWGTPGEARKYGVNLWYFLPVDSAMQLPDLPTTAFLSLNNETPGWLSSKITFAEQQKLTDLKVTGYINGSDIKFIRELIKNRNLHGCLDLEDANIVAGGEAYSGTHSTYDNEISPYMFYSLPYLRKLILPKSAASWSSWKDGGESSIFKSSKIDTLVINGNYYDDYYKSAEVVLGGNIRCIYVPEGVTSVDLAYIFYNGKRAEVFLPSTISELNVTSRPSSSSTIFHCASTNPQKISYSANFTSSPYTVGTMYVPKGTKALYAKSIFSGMKIIEEAPTDSIKFPDKEIVLYKGDNIQVPATVYPEDAIDKRVLYSVRDSKIASIYYTGDIYALQAGTTTVYAFSADTMFVDSCTIAVYEHTIGVELEGQKTIALGKVVRLNACTLPLETSDNKLKYRSSDDYIATVDSLGNVKGLRRGACTITATSVDGGYSAECQVTVVQPVEGLALEKHNISLNVRDNERLFAQIAPTNADNRTIIWQSANEQIASVDSDGNIVGVKAGNVWIKAVADDNHAIVDSCLVCVLQPVTGIVVSPATCTLENVGETFALTATITPEYASNKEIRWTSSNPSVCIASNGNIIAVGDGTCVIVATTVDGSYIAMCTVTIDTTTGVTHEIAETENVEAIYDITGKRLDRLVRGVNIILLKGGMKKKVVVQ